MGSLVGTLIKAHGFKGDMLLKLESNFTEVLEKGTPLFIEINKQRVPFFIEGISVDRSAGKAVVKMEFIDSDVEARKYTALEVYSTFSSGDQSDKSTRLSDFIHFHVEDISSGSAGEVVDFIDNPQNPLLIILIDKQELMIPINADYVKNVNVEAKSMIVDIPEGLFGLD